MIMPATKKKPALSPIRTIKYSALWVVALLLGLFVVGGAVEASTFFDETFETCNFGILAGCGYWKDRTGSYDFMVTSTEAQSGTKSITPNTGHPGVSHANIKDGTGIATTNSGIISFWFYTETYNTGGIFFGLKKGYQASGYDNWTPLIFSQATPDIYIGGISTSTERIAYDYPLETWNKVTIEYDYFSHKARAKFNEGIWSNYVILPETMNYADNILSEIAGKDNFYLDSIRAEALSLPTCGFEGYCSYCNASSTCQTHNCFWNEAQNFCYSTPAPELPALEECGGYGLTDRLTCEIKNFFYGLFVPSPTKILELKDTLELIKIKFPYNYALEIKDFFSYLKDNINENQAINFSVLGKAGVVSLGFWNSTTTLAGVSQSFLDIFKMFFRVIIILIFGLWCFSFVKRIFK